MCLIAVIRASAPDDVAEKAVAAVGEAWAANPDGAGFAFAYEGRVVVRKPFYKKAPLLRSLRRCLARRHLGTGSDIMVHLRYATHGSLAEDNVHPHRIGFDNGLALAHNGVLSGYGSHAKYTGDSDTRDFCKKTFHEGSHEGILDPEYLRKLGFQIGSHNKFVIMGTDGIARFVNEHAGWWTEGVWYSQYAAMHKKPSFAGTAERWYEDADPDYESERAARYGRWNSETKRYEFSPVGAAPRDSLYRPKLTICGAEAAKAKAREEERAKEVSELLAAPLAQPGELDALLAGLHRLERKGGLVQYADSVGDIVCYFYDRRASARDRDATSQRIGQVLEARKKAREEAEAEAARAVIVNGAEEEVQRGCAPLAEQPPPVPSETPKKEEEPEEVALDYSGVPAGEQGVAPAEKAEEPRALRQVGCEPPGGL